MTKLVLLLLCLAVCVPAAAGDPALVLGDKLVESGDHEAAVTEYKRFICFHPEDDTVGDIYLRIGRAYLALNEPRNAADSVQRSVEAEGDDRTREERRVSGAVLLLAMGDYSGAESSLLRVRTFTSDERLRRRSAFLLGVCYLYAFRWDEARQELDHYFAGRSTPDIERLRSLLSPAALPKPKSPKLARTLSTILPGAGQAYAGDYRGALNAFCINAIFGLPFARSVIDRRFYDAFASYSYLNRYYNGNRANSVKAVEKRNEELSRQHAKQVIEVLLKAGAEVPE